MVYPRRLAGTLWRWRDVRAGDGHGAHLGDSPGGVGEMYGLVTGMAPIWETHPAAWSGWMGW